MADSEFDVYSSRGGYSRSLMWRVSYLPCEVVVPYCVCLLKSEIAFAVYANKMGKESYCMVFLRNLCSLKTLHTNVWGIFLWMHLMSVALIATNVRKLYCIRTQTLNFDLWNTWSNSKRATCAAHIKHKHDKTWHFIGTTFKIKAILYCFKIVLILADLMRLTYSEQLYLALAQWITNLIYISAQRTYKKLSL